MKGRKLTVRERIEKLDAESAERRKLCKEYCEHLSGGLSKESFYAVPTKTLDKLISQYPEDFPGETIEQARMMGRDYWERLGRRQADGTCLGNSRTWYYNMANRFGWRERLEVEAEHKGSVQVNVVSYATAKARSDSVSGDNT